ncbi:MAG TPA: nucleotidyltransferase family protein [Chthoniobacterales bacterium]|nr:nucleotidyltransferase family protein [Chthoniobacterales bacterium]
MHHIGAVVLAAGGSSRFGRPKQLLTFRGETLVRRAVRAAAEAGCDPVIVVVGDLGDSIRSELDIRDSRISSFTALENGTRGGGGGIHIGGAMVVENAQWRRGLGTSIRRGLQEIGGSADAVVLVTCDQPLVGGSVIVQLIAAQQKTGKPIIASSYANTLGVPALFERSYFEALLALPDDSGAKKLIQEQADDVASIAFEDGAVDIDTPEDFERLKENRD